MKKDKIEIILYPNKVKIKLKGTRMSGPRES